jgi:hypothetical protein
MNLSMLPNHLPIDKAVLLIGEKMGEPVTSHWLLQHAHEGRIQVLALVREPVYFKEERMAPVDLTEMLKNLGGQKQSDYVLTANASKLEISNTLALKNPPRPHPDSADIELLVKRMGNRLFKSSASASNDNAIVPARRAVYSHSQDLRLEAKPRAITMMTTECPIECFSTGDFVPLDAVTVGRLFASTSTPRAAIIEMMRVKNKLRPLFTKSDQGVWKVAENDLFVKTSDLHTFSGALNDNSSSLGAKISGGEVTPIMPTSISQKTKEPSPLTIKQIIAAPWPQHRVDLRRALEESRAWIKPARVYPGAQGKYSSMWNPARLAMCLGKFVPYKKWIVKQQVLEDFITKYFPEWRDEWNGLKINL